MVGGKLAQALLAMAANEQSGAHPVVLVEVLGIRKPPPLAARVLAHVEALLMPIQYRPKATPHFQIQTVRGLRRGT